MSYDRAQIESADQTRSPDEVSDEGYQSTLLREVESAFTSSKQEFESMNETFIMLVLLERVTQRRRNA